VTTVETQPKTGEETQLERGFVGQNVPRKEDQRLLQGQGVFTDDIKRWSAGFLNLSRNVLTSGVSSTMFSISIR
jgi:hypothetical protein